jgi:hypothetical protein
MKKFSAVQLGILITTVITALVHLGLAFLFSRTAAERPMGILFLLNSLGYLTLLAAYFLPQPLFRRYHAIVRWGFVAFAAVTIIAWYIVNREGHLMDPLGLFTKLDEVILIVLLILDRSH